MRPRTVALAIAALALSPFVLFVSCAVMSGIAKGLSGQ